MRIRVTLPSGAQRRLELRTWQELYQFVGNHRRDDGRRVSVVADEDGFAVLVHDD